MACLMVSNYLCWNSLPSIPTNTKHKLEQENTELNSLLFLPKIVRIKRGFDKR